MRIVHQALGAIGRYMAYCDEHPLASLATLPFFILMAVLCGTDVGEVIL